MSSKSNAENMGKHFLFVSLKYSMYFYLILFG